MSGSPATQRAPPAVFEYTAEKMSRRRLTINLAPKPVMTVTRRAVKARRLVYIICTPKAQRYPMMRSRVIYIGTTEVGLHRLASSMASKAADSLSQWGVKYLEVYAVTCPPRPGLDSWRRLERDLLVVFKIIYGTVPKANSSGKNFTPDKLSKVFQYRRLVSVLGEFNE